MPTIQLINFSAAPFEQELFIKRFLFQRGPSYVQWEMWNDGKLLEEKLPDVSLIYLLGESLESCLKIVNRAHGEIKISYRRHIFGTSMPSILNISEIDFIYLRKIKSKQSSSSSFTKPPPSGECYERWKETIPMNLK